MLLFCPSCSNCLVVSKSPLTGKNRMECRTCPYEFALKTTFFDRHRIERKQVEDVLGGAGSWDNVDNTEAQCPAAGCNGTRAYFYMVQIRSADEPMTTFYKCMTCLNQWREN